MPTLKLTGATKSAPARKSPARSKPAAKRTPTRKPAAKTSARKPAAAAPASTNGSATRGPKLPEGWTQRDFNGVVKEMEKARTAREAAEAKLGEAQKAANDMALELLQEGVQMSVISDKLDLSRQWLYTLMEKNGITPARSQRKPASRGRTASTGKTSKPAAKKRPAAKPTAKKAPARKRPAAAPAVTGRGGRVRLAR